MNSPPQTYESTVGAGLREKAEQNRNTSIVADASAVGKKVATVRAELALCAGIVLHELTGEDGLVRWLAVEGASWSRTFGSIDELDAWAALRLGKALERAA